MARKFSLLMAAIVVVAISVPALAGASELTQGGKAVAVDTPVRTVSTNWRTETENFGMLACGMTTLDQTITEDGGGVVTDHRIDGTGSSCVDGAENAITYTGLTAVHVHLTSPTSGWMLLAWEADLPGEVRCHFEGFAAVTYTKGSGSIHISGEIEGGLCGAAIVSADLSVSSLGSPVVVD